MAAAGAGAGSVAAVGINDNSLIRFLTEVRYIKEEYNDIKAVLKRLHSEKERTAPGTDARRIIDDNIKDNEYTLAAVKEQFTQHWESPQGKAFEALPPNKQKDLTNIAKEHRKNTEKEIAKAMANEAAAAVGSVKKEYYGGSKKRRSRKQRKTKRRARR
jgi:hypothetical protein